jgi:hypothetical protein
VEILVVEGVPVCLRNYDIRIRLAVRFSKFCCSRLQLVVPNPH